MHSTKSKSKKKSHRPHAFRKPAGYSALDELIASPTEPMPLATQNHYFELILSALDGISGELTPRQWNALSEMVNIMQTMCMRGLCEDANGLVDDAVQALANAGRYHLAGDAIRLSAAEQSSVRAIAADFMEVSQVIPHREMVRCHRATQLRIEAYRNNRDVEIIDLKKASHAPR